MKLRAAGRGDFDLKTYIGKGDATEVTTAASASQGQVVHRVATTRYRFAAGLLQKSPSITGIPSDPHESEQERSDNVRRPPLRLRSESVRTAV